MRKVGHDRRLPIVVPDRPTADEPFDGTCATCEGGYKALERDLAKFHGDMYVAKRKAAEFLHGHFLYSGYTRQPLRWEVHCEHCHEVGER